MQEFSKSELGQTPSDGDMLQYARMDTHYLAQLREHLHRQLVEKDLLDLAREDFQRLCRVEPNHKDNPAYTQVSGYQHLEPQQLRVLDELCHFRDVQAKRVDRPLFKVISNSALLAVAQACPRDISQLKKVEGLSPKLIEHYAQELLASVRNGLTLEPIVTRNHKRPSDAYIKRLESLKEWRKNTGVRLGVQSDIILPRDILENIAGRNPENQSDLRLEMADIPWRYTHFGTEILEIIHQEN
jgi:ribonuclease D